MGFCRLNGVVKDNNFTSKTLFHPPILAKVLLYPIIQQLEGSNMRTMSLTVCPSCGGSLETVPSSPGIYRCTHCGNTYSSDSSAQQQVAQSYANCPVCGKDDQVKKVSSIIDADTHKLDGTIRRDNSYRDNDGHLIYYTSNDPIHGTETTILAQKLACPEKPTLKISGSNPENSRSIAMFFVFILITVCFMIGAGFLFMALAAFVGYLNDQSVEMISSGVFSCVSGVIGIGTGVLFLRLTRKSKDYEILVDKYKKSKQDQINYFQNVTMPTWERACVRWNHLFYCERCNRVFIPSEGASATLDQMQSFLEKG
jgi:ribosomal protein L37AE/L43A